MSSVSDKKPVQLTTLRHLAVGECCRIYSNDAESTHWLAQKNKKPYKVQAGIYQKVFISTKTFEYKWPLSYQTFCNLKTGEVVFIPTHCPCEKIALEIKTSQAY